MRIEAVQGALVVRFGPSFTARDAERASETILALAPICELTLDFSNVREFEHTAIVPLAAALSGLREVQLRLSGLTRHHERLLHYFGLRDAGTQPVAQA
jgi:hypothetical protein